jgi:hypothetical protein
VFDPQCGQKQADNKENGDTDGAFHVGGRHMPRRARHAKYQSGQFGMLLCGKNEPCATVRKEA